MEKITLNPITAVSGEITLPGSKSLSIRALLLAALSDAPTTLHGVLDSDDTQVMRGALAAVGAEITALGNDSYRVTPITGAGFNEKNAVDDEQNSDKLRDIFVGNSGLSIRTLLPMLAFSNGHFRLCGVPRMHERPIGDLVDSLIALGADIHYEAAVGFPPLLVRGVRAGALPTLRVKGNASSQYLTGLLQIAPLLAAQQAITIEVDGELISKPYVDMTLALMARFGVAVERTAYARFTVAQGVQYRSPSALNVEADASSASYFLAAAALSRKGASLSIRGVGSSSVQGDIGFAHFLSRLGATVSWQPESITVSGLGGTIPAFDEDFNAIPDAAMTAAVMALFANGPCQLRNIGSWRVKETDRLAAMAAELRKCGATVIEGPDYLHITPHAQVNAAQIATYDDHRMAMSFNLARFGGVPVTIEDPRCVAKTFPDYFRAFEALITP